MKLIKTVVRYGLCIGGCAFLFLFVLQVAYVEGDSMNDTYSNGDALLCLRLGTPEKGDVIICNSDAGLTLVKRVIATEGDTIDINFETGEVKINEIVLTEDYIKEVTKTGEDGFEYPVTVPDDCLFVMGDNRNASMDSRDTTNVGYIKESKVKGRVLLKLPIF